MQAFVMLQPTGNSLDFIGKYLLSVNCTIRSSLGEHTTTGFVVGNYSSVKLVYLIFMSCRIEQDKVTKAKSTQKNNMTE